MRINLLKNAICGDVRIPKGEYLPALLPEQSQINLAGGGKDYKIPAIRRRTAARTKVTNISFYSGGGNIWSLVIITPKHGEWIAYIEYESGSKFGD